MSAVDTTLIRITATQHSRVIWIDELTAFKQWKFLLHANIERFILGAHNREELGSGEVTPMDFQPLGDIAHATAGVIRFIRSLLDGKDGKKEEKGGITKPRIFVSIQMKGLGDSQYEKTRVDVIKLIRDLKENCDVFFYNEDIYKPKDFETVNFDPEEYLAEIDKYDYFIAVFTDTVVSSLYVEVGYALAKGKKVLCFAQHIDCIPTLLKLTDSQLPGFDMIISDQMSNILSNIRYYFKGVVRD